MNGKLKTVILLKIVRTNQHLQNIPDKLFAAVNCKVHVNIKFTC